MSAGAKLCSGSGSDRESDARERRAEAMKAYLLEEFGADLVERELDDPVPVGTEVGVRVLSCGLCHSDLHFHEGFLDLGGGHHLEVGKVGVNLPTALGHEVYGRIEDFGPDSGLGEADRGRLVIVFPWIGCGECEFCTSGRSNMCPAPEQIGVHRPGGYAAKIVVQDVKFLIDAQGVDPVLAGCYACSGLTAYSALKKLGSIEDESIGIIGLGGVGLMALAVAKGIGFENVVTLDIDDQKLRTARDSYGADRTFNARGADVVEAVVSGVGRLAGVVDFVGSSETVLQAAGLLRGGGVSVTVGLFGGELRFPLPALAVQQLQFRGSFTGTLAEFKELMGFVRAGRIKPIPARPVPFTDVNESMRRLRAGEVSGRIVLTHA
jgi:D-arabinose 1-dehydrogenase-like Zn-dependent alcohol dehydrogenase